MMAGGNERRKGVFDETAKNNQITEGGLKNLLL
jgi:hypothetical protein